MPTVKPGRTMLKRQSNLNIQNGILEIFNGNNVERKMPKRGYKEVALRNLVHWNKMPITEENVLNGNSVLKPTGTSRLGRLRESRRSDQCKPELTC